MGYACLFGGNLMADCILLLFIFYIDFDILGTIIAPKCDYLSA